MRKFGILGALVFALLLAASPATAAERVVFSGASRHSVQLIDFELYAPRAGTYEFDVRTSDGPCSVGLTVDDLGWIWNFHQVRTSRHVEAHLGRGHHEVGFSAPHCGWSLVITRD